MTLVCKGKDLVVKLKAYASRKRLDFFFMVPRKNHQTAYKSCTLSCVNLRFSKVAFWDAVEKTMCFFSACSVDARTADSRYVHQRPSRTLFGSVRMAGEFAIATWLRESVHPYLVRHNHSGKLHHVSSFGKIETAHGSCGIPCLPLP